MSLFHFLIFILSFTFVSQNSWASEGGGLELACLLKEGTDPDLPFSLSLSAQESIETTISPLGVPQISYRIKATYQDVMVGDTPKAALDYQIEKTDTGKKIRNWKFPRELLSKNNSSLVLTIKGKTPQADLKITCKSGE